MCSQLRDKWKTIDQENNAVSCHRHKTLSPWADSSHFYWNFHECNGERSRWWTKRWNHFWKDIKQNFTYMMTTIQNLTVYLDITDFMRRSGWESKIILAASLGSLQTMLPTHLSFVQVLHHIVLSWVKGGMSIWNFILFSPSLSFPASLHSRAWRTTASCALPVPMLDETLTWTCIFVTLISLVYF